MILHVPTCAAGQRARALPAAVVQEPRLGDAHEFHVADNAALIGQTAGARHAERAFLAARDSIRARAGLTAIVASAVFGLGLNLFVAFGAGMAIMLWLWANRDLGKCLLAMALILNGRVERVVHVQRSG